MVSVDQCTPGTPGRRRGERGAVLVEFALTVTIFLALIFGTVSYGIVFWIKSTATSAAEEGARVAIGGGSPLTKATDVLHASLPSKYWSGATVVVDANKSCTTNGVTATCTQVTVTYNYKDYPIVPKIPLFSWLPDQIQSIAMIQTS
jgi:Flp pilus assembly protein TadG